MSKADRDARNSAIARQMVEKPRLLGTERTRQLVKDLDPEKVEWIIHLGNRIVGSNAGKRFELK